MYTFAIKPTYLCDWKTALPDCLAQRMIPAMKVRNHPKVNWYPLPGGLVKPVEGDHPQESRIVIEAVHVGSVPDTVPLTGKF
jgi:hypothetical protein